MKIVIVSSGVDSLALFKFLNRYEHEYVIYFDSLNAPYGEKSLKAWLHFAKTALDRAQEQGAEKVILPPVLELACLEKWTEIGLTNDQKDLILPLFSRYLSDEVFPHSLVGKLGIFGEGEQLSVAQDLIAKLAESYSPTLAQQNIKKFSFPFHFWGKDTSSFSHLLQKLGWKSFLVNTVIKHDLRYFKDAMIDSLIPLNYSYFHAETRIKKFLNFKKMRFHGLEALEKSFERLTQNVAQSPYQVKVYSTDTMRGLLDEKRLLRYLQRGKSIAIELLN